MLYTTFAFKLCNYDSNLQIQNAGKNVLFIYSATNGRDHEQKIVYFILQSYLFFMALLLDCARIK